MKLNYGIKDETYKAVRVHESLSDRYKLTETKTIELFAVKNQSTAFQVLLFSDEEFSLSVTDAACFDKRGIINSVRLKAVVEDKADRIQTSMNIIGYVEDDDRSCKADILLNDENIYVEKGLIQPVWVELNIPPDAQPGLYEGRIEIFLHRGFEEEKKKDELKFTLEVAEVALPKAENYSFFLDLWQHNSNIARKHEAALWSEAHFEVIEKYIASLAKLGQKAASVIVSEIPWSGQYCYRDSVYQSNLFEYNIIKVNKDINGCMKLDFSALDRYMDLCSKYGIDSEIGVFGLLNIWMCEEEGFGKVVKELSDGIRVRYLDEKDGCYKYIKTVEELTVYIKEIEKHFIQRNMVDKVRIVADEPSDVEVFCERLNFLTNIAPSFKYKVAVNHVEFVKNFSDKVEDFVFIFSVVTENIKEVQALKDVVRGRIYWYVCCGPDIPNTFIRSHLLESYAIGLLTKYMELDGFLRWNYTVWPENPRERISFRSPYWKAGDTNFVYPSKGGAPLLTLRHKALLKGIQMFELLNMLESSGADNKDVLGEVFKKVFKFNDISEFSYKNIGELISLEYKDYMEAIKVAVAYISKQIGRKH